MLRNKEFRQSVIIFLTLAAVLITIGFIISLAAGILVLVSSAVFGSVFFVFTKARYRNLARLSEQIDLVLHNEDNLEFADFEEGELSILHSEIKKMTLRIKEQNDALKKDKQYLADSLADIAHQLRTPLTSANLALSLSAKTADENERQKFVREAAGLLVQTDWLITSLLKLSRLDAGVVIFKNEPIHVKDLIESALRPLSIPMELQNIETWINVPQDAVIQGDLNWLSEAIQNILKNCVESAGVGRSKSERQDLELSAHASEERGKIEITCNNTAIYTEIIIHDSGAGFSKKDLPRLFDRFYRGENQNAAGYGIGLALSKMIISRQGGVVTAKNHPNGGALFVIRFSK